MKYIEPKTNLASFTYPHYGVLAQQTWNNDNWYFAGIHSGHSNDLLAGHCRYCEQHTFWINDKMYFPETGNAPFPNPVMPELVKKLYIEAASISTKSPRGAAALLRLAIQVLCKELGEKGDNINIDIKELVKKELPEIVQQSLDIVRVTGNDAVHPGQVDTDNIEVVNKLFELINVIIEYMIALPNKVSRLYSTLPKGKIEGIKKETNKKLCIINSLQTVRSTQFEADVELNP